MGDQTEEPKSSGPHNSHTNAELSKAGHRIGRVRHSAARECPEARIPWRPTQGRGRYPAHKKSHVCLP